MYCVFTLLVCGFLYFILSYNSSAGIALSLNEPIYQGNSGQKAVAVMVNVDWGEEFIPAMLEELKKHNAKATFFVTGKWAEKNSGLVKRMHEEGHSVQNHGYKHLHFNSLSSEEAGEQIKKAEEIVFGLTGEKTRFFAPPYGEYNQRLLQAVASMNYKLIMWSIDTVDWKRPDPQTIVKRVANKLHNDALVLMHPTEPTIKALPELLQCLEEQGYKTLTIDKIIIENNGDS